MKWCLGLLTDWFSQSSGHIPAYNSSPNLIGSHPFSNPYLIDPLTVSVAILVGDQSRLKSQQMFGKLFNFQSYYTTEEEIRAKTIVTKMLKLHKFLNPYLSDCMEF